MRLRPGLTRIATPREGANLGSPPHAGGWAWAAGGPAVGGWNRTAPTHLDLGNSDAGEIDQHIFRAANGSTYIVWKTDDNSLQKKITRIWAQEIIIADGTVRLVGPRVQILDSSGMWWVTSFVQGGSLVEGPEIVEHGRRRRRADVLRRRGRVEPHGHGARPALEDGREAVGHGPPAPRARPREHEREGRHEHVHGQVRRLLRRAPRGR